MTEAITWMHGNPGKGAATIAVVLAFGLAALLVEYWIEKRRKGR